MNKKIVFLLAVVLAVALSLPRPAAAAAVMTTSNIKVCVNSETDINCENKTVVNAGVSYGARAILDVAYEELVQQQGGTQTIELEEPITFEITKTVPQNIYPLNYVHTVPYRPYEEVRRISNSSVGVSSCIDAASAVNPSCGWTLDAQGVNIPDSQGFCSNRDLLDLKSCGDNPASWRGDEVLGENSSLVNSYSTAHCLRQGTVLQGTVFFAGYEIGTPRRTYEVKTNVTNGTGVLTSFILSPDTPIYLDKTNNNPILAELMGEAMPPIATPDLSGYILYIPESPSSHEMVQQYWKNMLLVPRNMVTIDGSECNKVGTSFAAFRKQGMAAPVTVAGDCLSNQLYQLHQEDLAKLAGNPDAETRFLTTGMRWFRDTATFDTGLRLVVDSQELNYSTIALTLDRAQVGSVTIEAVGWIKEALCQPFYSMSKEGTMKVTVENVGSSATDYLVRLHDCNPGINPIPPKAKTLQPADIYGFIFDITTNVNMEGSHYCWVTLSSPQTSRVYDETQVFFDTHPYISKTASQWQKERRSKDSKKAN